MCPPHRGAVKGMALVSRKREWISAAIRPVALGFFPAEPYPEGASIKLASPKFVASPVAHETRDAILRFMLVSMKHGRRYPAAAEPI